MARDCPNCGEAMSNCPPMSCDNTESDVWHCARCGLSPSLAGAEKFGHVQQ